MNIRKIIAEELRKILKESIDSAFVRKYLSIARPTKTQYFVGLEFVGPMGDELFKSYKESKSTPAVKQLYAILKPCNLQLERNTKKNLLIFGDKEDMVKFLRVLEAAGTTFVKKFNESVVTEASNKKKKITAAELVTAVKSAGFKITDKENTGNAIKYWADGGTSGNFDKLIKLLEKHGGTFEPADHMRLSTQGVYGLNFQVNSKNNNNIYFAILKAPGKELADIGYDY